MFKNLLTVIFLFIGVSAFAQTGSIKGIIKDSVSKEDIIGASVFLEGTTQGAATDVDGSFEIRNVKAGSYNLIINFISYKKKTISGISVQAGQTTDLGNIDIKEDVVEGEEVVITGVRETHTESAVIKEIKESEQVVSGISSEQISKSQDRDAAQVVARVPGVTLVNNKFIMVRGLNERYNGVMLNGVNAPSTETDSRAFALDIIPSSMLDRMMVFKSGHDELIGDMTGSLVKVYTKSVVTENFTTANLSVSYRAGTTFSSQQTQTRYGSDYLGIGNLSREYPSSFPANVNADHLNYNSNAVESAAKSLNNDWNLNNIKVNPDIRFGVSLGRRYNIGSKKLSMILSGSYSNTWVAYTSQRSRNLYNLDSTTGKYTVPGKIWDYKLNHLQNNTNAGLIGNFSLALNHRNKIEWRNMYNQNGYTETIVRQGQDIYDNADIIDRSLDYQQRGIYSTQVSGEHELANDKTKIDWTLGYSNIASKQPDLRRGGYQRRINSNDDYKVVVPPQATDVNAARFSSNLKENIIAATVNAEHQLTKPKQEGKEGIKIRGGIYVEQRARTFSSRWMSYVMGNSSTINTALLDLPLETIFADENINTKTGFVLNEGTDGTNAYKASNKNAAGYVGATVPMGKFVATAGFRLEYNAQQIQTSNQGGKKIDTTKVLISPLTSAGLTYNINDKMLVRAAFAQTINRPEFREIAPFGFYDFADNSTRNGNPYLKTAEVLNYDLRWEFYPSADETFSLGGFYKDITNPIELYIEKTGTSNPAFYYSNAPKAKCYGIEAEVRKSLKFISSNPIFEKFSVLFNGALIKSEVNVGTAGLVTGQSQTRPLQGQSPYVANAGLYFKDEKTNLQINALYNVFGPRFTGIGNDIFATVYLKQRHVIDLTVTKGIGKHLELKAGIQDLLNQAFIYKEDSDRDFKQSSADRQVTYFKRGSYYTLGVNYKF